MKVVAVWEMQSGKAGAWIYPIHLKSLPGERPLLFQVYADIYFSYFFFYYYSFSFLVSFWCFFFVVGSVLW
jgi:hypothetical protein